MHARLVNVRVKIFRVMLPGGRLGTSTSLSVSLGGSCMGKKILVLPNS